MDAWSLWKKENEIFTAFASIVNDQCQGFKLAELSPDNRKWWIFVQDLVSTKGAEIWRKVLDKLENESNMTLKKLPEDCQRFINVRQDAKNIEVSGVSHIEKERQDNKEKKKYYSKPMLHVWRITFL